jgi:flavin-dependent dehydrogenase
MSHAIVVGGSISGLLAVRVLLDHFDQVTLVERDQLPDTPSRRPGVPQGHHVHALL